MSRRRQTLYDVLRAQPEARGSGARSSSPRPASAPAPRHLQLRPVFALVVLLGAVGIGSVLGYGVGRSSRPAPRLDLRPDGGATSVTYRVRARTYRWSVEEGKAGYEKQLKFARDDKKLLADQGFEAHILSNPSRRLLMLTVGKERREELLETLCQEVRQVRDPLDRERFAEAFISKTVTKNKR